MIICTDNHICKYRGNDSIILTDDTPEIKRLNISEQILLNIIRTLRNLYLCGSGISTNNIYIIVILAK